MWHKNKINHPHINIFELAEKHLSQCHMEEHVRNDTLLLLWWWWSIFTIVINIIRRYTHTHTHILSAFRQFVEQSWLMSHLNDLNESKPAHVIYIIIVMIIVQSSSTSSEASQPPMMMMVIIIIINIQNLFVRSFVCDKFRESQQIYTVYTNRVSKKKKWK